MIGRYATLGAGRLMKKGMIGFQDGREYGDVDLLSEIRSSYGRPLELDTLT